MERRRLLWLWAVGIGVLALVAVVWLVWTRALVAPQEVVVTIPNGTASRLEAGLEDGSIPSEIRLMAGDVFILRNDDIAPHRVGGLYVRPGGSVSQWFREAGTFDYICTIHPKGHTVFQVDGRSNLRILWWVEVGLLGILLQVSGILLGGWSTRWGACSLATGSATALLGLFLAINASGLVAQEGLVLDNPYPADTGSLNIGQGLYLQFCEVCHGVSGRGDGPLASSVDPPPADLIVHVPQHPDNVLFRFTQLGIPGSSMPPLGDTLTEEEIWHLINYLRSLE